MSYNSSLHLIEIKLFFSSKLLFALLEREITQNDQPNMEITTLATSTPCLIYFLAPLSNFIFVKLSSDILTFSINVGNEMKKKKKEGRAKREGKGKIKTSSNYMEGKKEK